VLLQSEKLTRDTGRVLVYHHHYLEYEIAPNITFDDVYGGEYWFGRSVALYGIMCSDSGSSDGDVAEHRLAASSYCPDCKGAF